MRLRLSFLFCLLFSCSLAFGQASTATVSGQVLDPNGALIIEATVSAKDIDTGIETTVETNGNGIYYLIDLKPGRYQFSVSKKGFKVALKSDVTLHVADMISMNFTMQVGGATETVAVTGAAPLVDTTSAETGMVIDRAKVDDLPVIDRTFESLALLTPTVQTDVANGSNGVGGGLSVGGQRGWSNNFVVDGMANRNSNGGMEEISYAQDWVEEFRVHASDYNAEYGGASGGIVNVVTRSGGNAFHGRAYGFFRTNDLNAIPRFSTTSTPFSEQRPGGTFSGPIIKNKLFFFSGFEYLNINNTAFVTAPLEPCNEPGTKRDPTTGTCAVPQGTNQKLWFEKLDWTPNDKNTFGLRYNGQDYSDTNYSVGGATSIGTGLYDINKYWGLAAAWTRILNNHTTNDVRASFTRAVPTSYSNEADTPLLIYPSSDIGSWCCHGKIAEDWVQLTDNLSLVRGKHDLKVGVDYANLRYYLDFRNIRDGLYLFGSDAAFNINDPTTYPLEFENIYGGNTSDQRAHEVGLFVQDSWKVLPRLTLNYGARYDQDNSLAISGANTSNTLSPRLGLAWQLDKQAKTVFRVGGGLFHDAEHTNLAGIFILNTLLAQKTLLLYASPYTGPLYNPFWNPNDPSGSVLALETFLAQALASNTLPNPNVFTLQPWQLTTNGIDKDFSVPETEHLQAGITREITSQFMVSADYLYTHSRNLFMFREENILPDGSPANPNEPNESNAASNGHGTYRALAFALNYRAAKRYATASYTWANCTDNTSATLAGGGGTSPFNPNVDLGPCDNDVRNTLVVSGGYTLPLGFEIGTIYSFHSGLPYSAATSEPVPLFTRYAPRNLLRGGDYSSWNLRVGKQFKFKERVTAHGFAEFFNLANQTSWLVYQGNVDAAQYGMPLTAYPMRQIQLGFRVDF